MRLLLASVAQISFFGVGEEPLHQAGSSLLQFLAFMNRHLLEEFRGTAGERP